VRPLTLLTVKADNEEQLPMRVVRARLAISIADEIRALRARSEVSDARQIFVLTRIARNRSSVADALAARGIPAVLAAQEGLYETEEARQVRDLLRAIADPHDPAKRLRAWLTPFFALSLADLPAAAAGAINRCSTGCSPGTPPPRAATCPGCSAASSTRAASPGASCSPATPCAG
jgi:exodeoxyribonuclease V beta subunit